MGDPWSKRVKVRKINMKQVCSCSMDWKAFLQARFTYKMPKHGPKLCLKIFFLQVYLHTDGVMSTYPLQKGNIQERVHQETHENYMMAPLPPTSKSMVALLVIILLWNSYPYISQKYVFKLANTSIREWIPLTLTVKNLFCYWQVAICHCLQLSVWRCLQFYWLVCVRISKVQIYFLFLLYFTSMSAVSL